MQTEWDVVIIGGSNAGLSAAMTLGRSLRSTLVVDNGQPCNRQTPYSHNFLSRDGIKPAELAAIARDQVLAYPSVQWLQDTVVQVEKTLHFFQLTTIGGSQIKAEKLLFATGIQDEMLPIPGFADCWGISVLHCPYCHGYEVRGQKLAILANGAHGFDFAQLIRQWSTNLIMLTNGPHLLTQDQLDWLSRASIEIMEEEINTIEHTNGYLNAVHLKNRSAVSLDAVFARVPFHLSQLVRQLSLPLTDYGFIAVNALQATSVPGIYAAGDCTSPMRAISAAAAAGTIAGAAINKELLN